MVRKNEERLELLLRGQGDLMQELHGILGAEEKKDDQLRTMVLSSFQPGINQLRDIRPERLFHVDEIRRACIKYRLRFLPAGRFKGRLPNQALYQLRQLESLADAPLQGFMIMAPAKRFKLCDCDADPLLFIPVGEGMCYLVHRWGPDMAPWRAAIGWPVRSWKELAITVVVLAWIAAAVIPTSLISTDPSSGWWGSARFFTFFWTTMFGTGATVFAWFTFFGQFSTEAWNSKTFN